MTIGSVFSTESTDPPADLLLSVQSFDQWKIVSASYRGLAHIEKGVPRQDQYKILCNYQTQTLSASIADGLSSADCSEFGAIFAAELACKMVDNRVPQIRHAADMLKVGRDLQGDFFRFARQHDLAANSLATTLQVAAIHGEKLAYLRIGDGGCVISTSGGNIAVGTVGSAGIGTHNLSDANCLRAADAQLIALDSTEAVFLFSDGVHDFFIKKRDGIKLIPHDQNIEKFVEIIKQKDLSKLVTFLNYVLGGDHDLDYRDDKTLIMLCRTSDNVIRQVPKVASLANTKNKVVSADDMHLSLATLFALGAIAVILFLFSLVVLG